MTVFFRDKFHKEIEKVANDVVRPLWSVLIPTYNCAKYLKYTLQSVLMQDPGPEKMEILVIDDHSQRDDPEAVINEFGKGRVKFVRQAENVGKVRNYETGLSMSKGHIIHQLHGDDMVCDGFYYEMENLLNNNPIAKAAFCRSIYIDYKSRWIGMTGMIQDEEGIVPNMAERLYVQQKIQTPSMVVKREVYETIGAFDRRLDCMEDWEMWIRIANTYPVAASNRVLAQYRTHDNSATNLTFEDGSALQTHNKVFDIVDTYINPEIKSNLFNERNKKQADFLALSFSLRKSKLTLREKVGFIKSILNLDSSPSRLIRLFRS